MSFPTGHSGSRWSRRDWLAAHAAGLFGAAAPLGGRASRTSTTVAGEAGARHASLARALDPGPAEALVLRAVDAAKAAGAEFASARLTRTVWHLHDILATDGFLYNETELQGIGVQVLVGGCWGFASSPDRDPDRVVRVARAAVAQAKANASRAARPIDLGHVPAVRGRWATPIKIDPLTIPVEERRDHIEYWRECLRRYDLLLAPAYQNLRFTRQERAVATTEGALVTQTTYESGGTLVLAHASDPTTSLPVPGLTDTGKGWELVLDARVPERLPEMVELLREESQLNATRRPGQIGRYTLVCDGATMAALVDATFGVATQLDRALGYEANAGGTSYLNDPLGMLGQLEVASQAVTITANRSAPAQLATVKWDDEGVEPEEFTLVKDGVLVDYQTTRESASWLREYYAKQGKPVKSHGCAAAQDALAAVMQHPPNLALEPAVGGADSLEALAKDVADGVLVTNGVATSDFQARTGLVSGALRRIRDGKLGARLVWGAVMFNSDSLWKSVIATGGPGTRLSVPFTQYGAWGIFGMPNYTTGPLGLVYTRQKGDPPQLTSRTVSAPAAVIKNQAMINPSARA